MSERKPMTDAPDYTQVMRDAADRLGAAAARYREEAGKAVRWECDACDFCEPDRDMNHFIQRAGVVPGYCSGKLRPLYAVPHAEPRCDKQHDWKDDEYAGCLKCQVDELEADAITCDTHMTKAKLAALREAWEPIGERINRHDAEIHDGVPSGCPPDALLDGVRAGDIRALAAAIRDLTEGES